MNVFVIIPSYKVKDKVLSVIERVPSFVSAIICVDDKCPEESGKYIEQFSSDRRVHVFYNLKNRGVGGAVKRGFLEALKLGADICVKIDGDGQMDPALIERFIKPIEEGSADYTKGNRFYNIQTLKRMPLVRLFGNTGLSFINKFVTGYWNVMDPTNGLVAIHIRALSHIDLEKVSNRYFFESDMLYHLSLCNAVVKDMDMDAFYDDENSNLSVAHSAFTFPMKYLKRFIIRFYCQYLVINFSFATVAFLLGSALLFFGFIFGIYNWIKYTAFLNELAPSGTIMISVLTILVGTQFLLFFFQHDMANIPKHPIQNKGYENDSFREA